MCVCRQPAESHGHEQAARANCSGLAARLRALCLQRLLQRLLVCASLAFERRRGTRPRHHARHHRLMHAAQLFAQMRRHPQGFAALLLRLRELVCHPRRRLLVRSLSLGRRGKALLRALRQTLRLAQRGGRLALRRTPCRAAAGRLGALGFVGSGLGAERARRRYGGLARLAARGKPLRQPIPRGDGSDARRLCPRLAAAAGATQQLTHHPCPGLHAAPRVSERIAGSRTAARGLGQRAPCQCAAPPRLERHGRSAQQAADYIVGGCLVLAARSLQELRKVEPLARRLALGLLHQLLQLPLAIARRPASRRTRGRARGPGCSCVLARRACRGSAAVPRHLGLGHVWNVRRSHAVPGARLCLSFDCRVAQAPRATLPNFARRRPRPSTRACRQCAAAAASATAAAAQSAVSQPVSYDCAIATRCGRGAVRADHVCAMGLAMAHGTRGAWATPRGAAAAAAAAWTAICACAPAKIRDFRCACAHVAVCEAPRGDLQAARNMRCASHGRPRPR